MHHAELKIKWNNKLFPKLIIAEGRKSCRGMNGVLNKYNIQFDAYIFIVRCDMIIIPCSCIE